MRDLHWSSPFKNRNSVGAAALCASCTWNPSVSVISAQRVQFTILMGTEGWSHGRIFNSLKHAGFIFHDFVLLIVQWTYSSMTIVCHHATRVIADHESRRRIDSPSDKCILKASWPIKLNQKVSKVHIVVYSWWTGRGRWRGREIHGVVHRSLRIVLLAKMDGVIAWKIT